MFCTSSEDRKSKQFVFSVAVVGTRIATKKVESPSILGRNSQGVYSSCQLLRRNILLKNILRVLMAALACTFLSISAFAGNVTVAETVAGTDGPWSYVNGGLNTGFQYGVGDQTAPVVISAANGLSFAAGSQLTISYVSGLEAAGPGWASVDANGLSSDPVNNNTGSSGTYEPSDFLNSSTYPINLSELVGTFANSSGTIVGTPFAIGDGPFTATVPLGATQLQLGINDDIYSDNTGSFVVNVSGNAPSATPEPSSLLLFGSGIFGLAGVARRKFCR